MMKRKTKWTIVILVVDILNIISLAIGSYSGIMTLLEIIGLILFNILCIYAMKKYGAEVFEKDLKGHQKFYFCLAVAFIICWIPFIYEWLIKPLF